MEFLKHIVTEWRVIRAAPISFATALVAGWAATFAALTWYYSRQADEIQFLQTQLAVANQEITKLKEQGSATALSPQPIVPNQPSYVTTMSNDNMKTAAYVLASKIDEFASEYSMRDYELMDNDSLAVEERAKRRIQLAVEFDQKFRAEFALNAANMLQELNKRTGTESSEIEELNEGQIDTHLAGNIAFQLVEQSKRLK